MSFREDRPRVLLLGIGVGTYSSKGVLVQADGTLVKTPVAEHEMSVPHPGWAEQEPDVVWQGDVVKIRPQRTSGALCRGSDVGAVAVSAFGPCMLPPLQREAGVALCAGRAGRVPCIVRLSQQSDHLPFGRPN